jgi:FG-GAP-like repeat/FG-GAP repeat
MRALVLVPLLTLACGGRAELDSPTALPPADGGGTADQRAPDAGASGAPSCTWGFAPPVDYPGGPEPSTVAIGDLDGDGHADLAVNSYGDSNTTRIQTLRNRGDGTFVVDTSFPSTVGFSMAIGPFVSSKNDLLVGCDLFENEGNGTFGPALRYGIRCGDQDSLANLVTADFNGDGLLDFAWGLSNSAVVQLNQGRGAFKAIETQLSPSDLHLTTLASADFDHDGVPDLAAACWGYGNPNFLALLHGKGDGSFDVTTIDTGDTIPTSIAAGDVDGDGYADVLTTTTNPTGLEVRLQRPDGSFSEPAFYAAFLTNPVPLLGDINGDGVNDLVLADVNGVGMGYFLNAGNGTFGKQVITGNDGSLWHAALGDVNGDGHVDIVAAVTLAQPGGYAEVWLSRCQ